jgi:hypothetical protein
LKAISSSSRVRRIVFSYGTCFFRRTTHNDDAKN